MAKAEYRSAQRSRKMIVDALADLLLEKSLERITVTDVVTRAGLNRGTFYAHYRDIPDVVDHLIQQAFSSIEQVLANQEEALPDMAHSLLTQVQLILEEDLPFYQKILASNASLLMQNRLVEFVEAYFLQNKDRFYSGSREEFELAIRFCAGGLTNLYQDWFSGKLNFTLDELTQIGEELIRRIIVEVK